MVDAKYGFAQSMDCAAQTMDPYFVRAIHGLRIHVAICVSIIIFFIFTFQLLFFYSVHVHGLHKPAS